MDILFNIFKLLAGIGLFLFAMYLLEESLKNLSGRNFKIFLQRIASNNLGAVTGGAIVTGVLQSSSLVSVMILAFVGAGVLTMKNAMAIILGANLGTTLASWLVATLGFKVNIEVIAYPAVCIGGFLLMLFGNRQTIKYLSLFLLGFGILFIGLAFMKSSMEAQVKEFDFSAYAEMSSVVFLLIGFVITLIVQSSSVTMALSLSALHAGVIGFAPAAAIVLGSETGTTIKILLASIGGNASKKRVALGNFMFNIFLTGLAFIFLKLILFLITDILNISDPLIGLVTFSSLINLLGIIIFLPFLNPFSKFLEGFYKDTDATATAFIGNANIGEPETALDLFRRETEYFIYSSMFFNVSHFEIDKTLFWERPDLKNILEKRKFFLQTPEEKYEFLKQLQGELQAFYVDLRNKLQGNQVSQINQLISSVRSSMHSIKSMKDIGNNIANLKRSSKDIKFDFFMQHKKTMEELYDQINALFDAEKEDRFGKLKHIYDDILNNYTLSLNNFYKEAQSAPLEDMDITIVINFNRELFYFQ
ncbi:MAG: Na/Pi cotransporter family protein [Saprospiraceae bacterium]|nr:Na/Pi cotransporter family protein [Saprospiraceae bacterium]